MAEGYGIALITVLGAIATAVATALLSRSRIGRLEAVSRILKDLPIHDPAYADLAQIRKEDARALLRAQQSPWTALVGFALATLVLGFIVSEFGEAIREWSQGLYYLLAGGVIGSFLGMAILFLAFLCLGAFLLGKRVFRWVRDWPDRSGQTRPRHAPTQANEP